MSNKVVKYHNDLNRISMRGWTPEEMNFFFAIIWKLRKNGEKEIKMNRAELRELAEYSDRNQVRYRKTLKQLSDHMLQMWWQTYKYENGRHSLSSFVLFHDAEFEWNDDLTDLTAKIKVSDKFKYIVDELDANFTSYELKEFTQLRSTYAKTAYRLLKQYRTTGYRKFDIDEFKMLFGIPKSYRATNINKRVFVPILNELKPYFLNLEIKPIKKRTHGNPIIEYEFRWQPSLIEEWDDEKYDKKALATSQRVKRSKNANDPSWYDDKETHQASDEIIQQALAIQEKRKSE